MNCLNSEVIHTYLYVCVCVACSLPHIVCLNVRWKPISQYIRISSGLSCLLDTSYRLSKRLKFSFMFQNIQFYEGWLFSKYNFSNEIDFTTGHALMKGKKKTKSELTISFRLWLCNSDQRKIIGFVHVFYRITRIFIYIG